MISKSGAAVFYGNVDLKPNTESEQIWKQSYHRETFKNIYGGSIQVSGNNLPVTVIEESVFINNFSENGASISLDQGGSLFIEETTFMLDFMDDSSK